LENYFIFIDELPKEEQQPFVKWLFGQTVPIVEGQENRKAAFRADYNRWVFKTKK